jgi:hypothetical protein
MATQMKKPTIRLMKMDMSFTERVGGAPTSYP